MSEADDIKEFMGLVGKGHERATKKDMAEVQRQLAAVVENNPDLIIGGPSDAEIARYIKYCNKWISSPYYAPSPPPDGKRLGKYVEFDPSTGLFRRS